MPLRVLILDKDPILCDLYRATLEAEGYTVIVAATSPEIGKVIRHQPDLILLDHFYGATPLGWIFLIELKTYSETEDIPVVLCTSDEAAVKAQASDLASFNVNVIYKPFELHDFLATIRYSLPSDCAEQAAAPMRTPSGNACHRPSA